MIQIKKILNIIISSKKIIFQAYLFHQLYIIMLLPLGILINKIFNCFEYFKIYNAFFYTIILFLFTLIRFLFTYIYSKKEATFTFQLSNLLRRRVILNLFNIEVPMETNNINSAQLINSLRFDVFQIVEFLRNLFIDVPSVLIFAIISIIVLIRINYNILFICIFLIIIIFLIIKFLGIIISKYRISYRWKTGSIVNFIVDFFRNIRNIRMFCCNKEIEKKFSEENEKRMQSAMIDNFLTDLLKSLYKNSSNFITCFVLFFVSLYICDIILSLGELTLFLYFVNYLSLSLEAFGELFVNFKRMKISIKNIENLSRQEIYTYNFKDNKIYNANIKVLDNSLNINNIFYTYQDSHRFIQIESFDFDIGKFNVICGELGCGKSTLLKYLARLFFLYNTDENREVDIKVGYLPQEIGFIDSSIKENILLGLNQENYNIIDAIKVANLEEDIKGFSDNIETSIGDNGSKLSGGQRKRLGVARMIINNPDLLIIDNLSTSLDKKTAKIILENILSLNKTIICVSNDCDEIKMASKVFLMKNGKIISVGNYDSLYKENEYFRNLLVK